MLFTLRLPVKSAPLLMPRRLKQVQLPQSLGIVSPPLLDWNLYQMENRSRGCIICIDGIRIVFLYNTNLFGSLPSTTSPLRLNPAILSFRISSLVRLTLHLYTCFFFSNNRIPALYLAICHSLPCAGVHSASATYRLTSLSGRRPLGWPTPGNPAIGTMTEALER